MSSSVQIRLERTCGAIVDTALSYSKERATAYFEAASFVKYMLDVHGPTKFKRVYRGFTFESIYGKSIDELDMEWLDATFPDLGDRALMKAATAAN